MSTVLIFSNIFLWVLMVPLVILNLILFRQMGILIMGTARGVNNSGVPIGKKLPSFKGHKLDGSIWDFNTILGKSSLFLFVSPFCGECKKILPDFIEITKKYNTNAILFIFSDIEGANEYIRKINYTGQAIIINQEQGAAIDVSATPFAYAINSQGIVEEKGLVNTFGHLEKYVKSISQIAA